MAEWTPTRVVDQDDVDPSAIADGRVPVARDQGGGVFVHEYEVAAGGGGPPSGPAGGALDGTYPNPGLAASVAGDGLAETADVLSVNVDGVTIEISADALRVKDGGITIAKLAFDPATQAELDAAIAALAAVYAPLTRTLTAGAGLSGGGSLAADRTFDVNVDASTIEINADILRVVAGGITANEIATNAVGSDELADNAVDTNAIQNGAVTAAKVAADVATQAELDAHINDPTDAHDASAVSVDSTTLSGTATDVQGSLEEIDNLLDDHSARHENGGADEINVAGLSGELADAQPVTVRKNTGADVGTRSRLNLIEGSGVTLTVADDAGSDEVDITIAASGGGGSGEALTRDVTQTAHGFAVGDVLRIDGTDVYVAAQANSIANAEVAGIVVAVAGVNDFTLHLSGYIDGLLSGLTAETVYYLSPTSAGDLTATEPTDAGEVSKPLLIATDTDSGYWFNWRGIVVAEPTATPDLFNYLVLR